MSLPTITIEVPDVTDSAAAEARHVGLEVVDAANELWGQDLTSDVVPVEFRSARWLN